VPTACWTAGRRSASSAVPCDGPHDLGAVYATTRLPEPGQSAGLDRGRDEFADAFCYLMFEPTRS
jgi:hypothetical protein